MGRNLNDLKTENMDTRDELKEMIVSHAASWKKEEGKDDMADIYVDDFLNELLSKFKLLPIQNVVGSAFNIKDLELFHFAIIKALPHTNKKTNGYAEMIKTRDKLAGLIKEHYR